MAVNTKPVTRTGCLPPSGRPTRRCTPASECRSAGWRRRFQTAGRSIGLVGACAAAALPANEPPAPPDATVTLSALAGSWTRVTEYHTPEGTYRDTGSSTHTWTLGGRYLECRLAGGDGLESLWLFGAANDAGSATLTMLDRFSTSPATFAGTVDAPGHRLTFRGTESLPWAPAPTPIRIELDLSVHHQPVVTMWARLSGSEWTSLMTTKFAPGAEDPDTVIIRDDDQAAAPGANADLHAGPLTMDEYRGVSHSSPYVLDLDSGDARLVYVGVNHGNEPESLEMSLIERLWSQLAPELALNEGGDPPSREDRDEAIRHDGEAGLVRYLARRDHVPVTSLDPTRAEQVAALRDRFSVEQLKLYFCLLQVSHLQRNPIESLEDRMRRVFQVLGRIEALECEPNTLEELRSLYRETFAGAGRLEDVPSSWFDPTREDTILNRISRASSGFRDEFVIARLTRELSEGKRVFAVMGVSHVVMQEPALRTMLAGRSTTSVVARRRLVGVSEVR